ncbi:MAG: hypothetical protein K0B15_11290 [Lentimicrobium sp.]|nr:hypothetical protein [Lentimicrobium sp.]
MANTKRTKILLIIIAVLTLVNIGAAVSVFLHVQKYKQNKTNDIERTWNERDSKFVRHGKILDELGFTDEQAEELKISRDMLRQNINPHFGEIKRMNQILIDEVLKEEPDTLLIESLCREIGENHAQMRYHSAKHLIEMRTIATPDQYDKLEGFFREMIMRDESKRGEGPRRRHRWGQKN